MREVQVQCVYLSSSAAALLEPDNAADAGTLVAPTSQAAPPEVTRLGCTRTALSASLAAAQILAADVPALVLPLGEASLPPDTGKGGISSTPLRVAVGHDASDLALAPLVDVYFHTGSLDDLGTQQGVTIPLTGQGAAGVRNVLRWAAHTRKAPQQLVDHADVAAHAAHAAEQYLDYEHVQHAESHSRKAARDLMLAFPQIIAVLGTGFPFYCMSEAADTGAPRIPVPPSIIHYTATQQAFLARKLLPLEPVAADRTWDSVALANIGLSVDQTPFSAYEYTRHGVEPPQPPANGRIQDFISANTCSRADRPWPCHLCTTLHDAGRYAEQAFERDFMVSCLRCNQTPFLPRAIGVLGSDIDLVAIIADSIDSKPTAGGATPDEDSRHLAERIAAWIDAHCDFFRHDTRWESQLGAEHGPLDVFITTQSAFLTAARQMSDGDDGEPAQWMSVTVPAAVTWLPVTTIAYELGKYLPLCMELLADRSDRIVGEMPRFTAELAEARQRFARQVSAHEIREAYRSDSSYLQQLAGNDSVHAVLEERLELWRKATPVLAPRLPEGGPQSGAGHDGGLAGSA